MTDIKKDTLKNQLDDALRQSTNATIFINPEMAVVQLNTIMDEQILKFKKWYDESDWVSKFDNSGMNDCLGSFKKASDKELLQIFKQENGL